jgi:hypothetical protein
MGANPQPCNVRRIDFSGLTGQQMLEKITAAPSGAPDSSEYVADRARQAGCLAGCLMRAKLVISPRRLMHFRVALR